MSQSEVFRLLKALCETCGVSGDEERVFKKIKSIIKDNFETSNVFYDKFGNLIVEMNDPKLEKSVLLEAHADEIGFRVVEIADGGFVRLAPCGGIDNRVLKGQAVKIFSKTNIDGVICAVAPHLARGTGEMGKSAEQIWVDTGLDKKQVQASINLGDSAVIFKTCQMLNGDFCTAKAIDNRGGVVAVLLAMKMLEGKDVFVRAMFSKCEEVGLRGAKANTFNADYALVIDSSFGNDPKINPWESARLGGGAMIGISPTLSKELSRGLIAAAQKHDIPVQTEVLPESTGTTADVISTSMGGIKTCTISYPILNMHTPTEIVSLKDLENTAKLISEFVKEF